MCKASNKALAAVGLLLGLAATGPRAAAAPISVTFEGTGPGNGSAAQYNWNTGATTYPGIVYTPTMSSPNHFATFCIEQDQFISGGTTYTDYTFSNLETSPVPGPAMLPATADAIRAMWAQYHGTLGTDNNANAGFQNAIWHLLKNSYTIPNTDPSYSYYSAYITPGNWQSGFANLATMVSTQHQDQVFELQPGYAVIGGNIQQVPAPPALVVAALLAPTLVLRRKVATKKA